MRIERCIFAAAAVYNVAFGLWAASCPQAFFNIFELPAPRYPSIWACLGMVVGLYGILYAYVAWRPDDGQWIALVGLAGKVLGPVGWLLTVSRGELPPRTFGLILANDLVWWFPFLFYLLRGTRWRATILTALAVIVHVAACVGLLVVQGGTEITPQMSDRAEWVAKWPMAWIATWLVWALASLSLAMFFLVWAGKLRRVHPVGRWASIGCGLVIIGLVCDLAGETTLITRTTAALSVDDFGWAIRRYQLLGPAAANGLYCLGGLLTSALAWRIGWLRGGWGALGLMVWIAGLALTVAALVEHRGGMVIMGAAVMLLFIPWATFVGWRMRPGASR